MANTTRMAKEPIDTPITRVVKRFNSFWPTIVFAVTLLVGMGRMIAQQENITRQIGSLQSLVETEIARRQQTEVQMATVLERLRTLESKRP